MFLRGIGTHDIYIGILPFVGVQLLVLGLLIAWPGLVLRDTPAPTLDAAAVERELERLTPPGQRRRRPTRSRCCWRACAARGEADTSCRAAAVVVGCLLKQG
jgi:hypothetical protein